MAQIAPPPSPPLHITLEDGDSFQRFQTRLWLVGMTILTVLITAWFATLGTAPAIIALVIAKHVLVALLVMGLEVDEKPR